MPETRANYWDSIVGLLKSNQNIKDADEYFEKNYEETDEVINTFLEKSKLTNEEFIAFIALRRLDGLRRSSGNGSNAMMDQIRREYKNTPWKFIEEFLQNADDCTYDGTPEIKIIVDERRSAIEFVYNERGFTRKDIWALTQFSDSTKPSKQNLTVNSQGDGLFYNEKTGRKGIGFKSVFSLDAENVIVHICSNGFSFRLSNSISSNVPVWEQPISNDNNTHVRVELVNPNFSLYDIYPKFKDLFCVSNRSRLFSDSPILFMHKLRAVGVEHHTNRGTESFSVALDQNQSQTEYGNIIYEKNDILSGISYNGKLCSSELARINICFQENNDPVTRVPCLRYSETIKVNGYWNVFSVIAPIIRGENTWYGGALFRTFSMIDHIYPIPFAMNLPYELNMARKGISYSDAVTENGIVSEKMFKAGGVFRIFLSHLRKCIGISIDQYFPANKAVLFDDTNNRNRDGYYVPLVDLKDILSKEELFPLLKNENKYISLNNLACVDEQFLDWPESQKMLTLLLGNSVVDRLVARKYLSCSLLRDKRTGIIDSQFVLHMNEYLQLLERQSGLTDGTLADFISKSFYPFLCRNQTGIIRCDGFQQLKIYLFEMADGTIVRENCNMQTIWLNGTTKQSFRHYRTISSSKTDLSPLLKIGQPIQVQSASSIFSKSAIQQRAQNAKQLDEILNEIEETVFYTGNYTGAVFPALKGFALSSDTCEEENPLRDAGLLQIIEKKDALRIAKCFDRNLEDVVHITRSLGLREADDFLEEVGTFWRFNELTRKFLDSGKENAAEGFIRLLSKKLMHGRKLDLSYEEIRNACTSIKLFFFRKPDYIVREAYNQLCAEVLNDIETWRKKSNESTEMLLRAVSKVSSTNIEYYEQISIDIKYLVDNQLGTFAKKATERHNFDKYLRIKNNGYFEKVSKQEVADALIATELDDLRKKEEAAKTFYRGDLSKCHSEGKPIEFLLDTLSNAVYLHGTEDCDFREAFIYKYLQCRFDSEKNKLLDQVRKQTRAVYEKTIKPVLDRTNDDWDTAFDLISQDFHRMSEEDIINIIARFRLQSYSESLGNASQSHETEILEDYRQESWKFAYEFLQNTDDCTFPANVVPEISVEVNKREGSISFEYNEFGFSLSDIYAITSFGNSQKSSDLAPIGSLPETGIFDREKTGRKGRGFKSVFALPGKNIVVHILSNRFSFKFEKRLGEIIPIWEQPKSAVFSGTRITVEGFPKDSIDTLYQRLLDTLFVKDQKLLFASSPLLFLRKLRRVNLTDGQRSHRFELQEENAIYTSEIFRTNSVIVSGVRENGKYKPFQLANVIIHQQSSSSEPVHVKALRFSYMKDIMGRARLVSIMMPVITKETNFRYSYGSLYRTLPLGDHRLPIPMAINAAFNLNSGRSAILNEENELNNVVNRLIFNECLPDALSMIRDIPQIAIDAYIPSQSNEYNILYTGMMHVEFINVRKLIRKMPLLKLYSGKGYISCDDASVLSAECYTWPAPTILSKVFEENNRDCLVLEEYRRKIDELHNTQIINSHFCNHIDQYVDIIEKDREISLWDFFSEKLYTYITVNYDNLKHAYWGDESSLQGMHIFAYTDADGHSHRESGNNGSIWIKNCPEKYGSYRICRSFASAPVRYNLDRNNWISTLLNAIEYNEFQAGYGYDTDTWDKAVTWLKIGLYYNCRRASKLGYLHDCALSEEISPEENIFRQAYSRVRDTGILSRIIDKHDIDQILEELSKIMEIQQSDVVMAIQRRGLRKANDFFEKTPEFIQLNKPTLVLFRTAGFERKLDEYYVKTVVQACNEKFGNNSALKVSFADLKGCSPVIFTCFFRMGMFSDEIRSRIAKNYFDSVEPERSDKKDDYNETYIICMGLVNENLEASRNIIIKISEIKNRRLGEFIQKAQFSSKCQGTTLTISRDIPCNLYESREIKQSLHWLSEDNELDKEITGITYYTADISDAFVKADTAQYICDSDSVIVNNQDSKEHILDYVKHKYSAAGNRELLLGLIKIAGEQYELQHNWNGTKEEYITKLGEYRSETNKYVNFLCPGYQRRINEATGDVAGGLISELLQNINDCICVGKQNGRSLFITMDNQTNTMTLTYDELGFQFDDVYSITAYGQSTKHDEREGEKGLGFKKVFTVFSQVDIYSNDFSFSLTDKKPTVPKWIQMTENNKQYMQTGKTTMVFKFRSAGMLSERITSIWEDAVKESDEAGLLLGLRNISNFELNTATGQKSITRGEILKHFYIKELPLLETYKRLHGPSAIISADIKNALRSRTKCSVMNDLEFESYINKLSVSAYIPKKHIASGVYYSTLPTSKSSGCSICVDMPLELSTGRNEVMLNSRFNDAVFRLVYYPDGGSCSVMSYLLTCIAKENTSCRIFDYITDVEKYITVISGSDAENIGIIRNELLNLPIVHTYERDSLVSVRQIYTAQRIVYEYMKAVDKSGSRYDDWLKTHYGESMLSGIYLASHQDGIKRSLMNYAIGVGGEKDHYPLSGTNNEYTIQYFESEYGTEGR